MSIVQRSIELKMSFRENWLLSGEAGFASCNAATWRNGIMEEMLDEMPRRSRFGQTLARWAATCAMGSWVVIGVVPVVVVICALR
jgi:hypothetical protein